MKKIHALVGYGGLEPAIALARILDVPSELWELRASSSRSGETPLYFAALGQLDHTFVFPEWWRDSDLADFPATIGSIITMELEDNVYDNIIARLNNRSVGLPPAPSVDSR